MRNTQVAEWILSLVTSPERAASTVGDLLEDAAHRGAAWFWFGAVRTALSMLWREFSGDPAHMMGLAVRGFLVQFVFLAAYLLVFFIVAGLTGLFAGQLWLPTGSMVAIQATAIAVGKVVGTGIGLLISFQIGRWLARRSPGRELAPIVALAILETAVTVALGLVLKPVDTMQVILGITVYQVYQLPMFVGAAWVRRKSLRA